MTAVTFFERPASTSWEVLPIPGVEGVSCWAWYRPEHLPFGVVVSVPLELIQEPGAPLPFSLFHLVHGVGLPWEYLESVSLYGGEWQPATFWNTMAGDRLPPPTDSTQNQIVLLSRNISGTVPTTQSMTAVPSSESGSASAAPPTASAATTQFGRLEADWKACLGLERQLSGMRQQLSGVLGRLGALDRDLRPEENLAADRVDKEAWQDARRWIRDASSKVQRCIKAHDIGMTSAAGHRNVIQQTYEQAAANVGSSGDLSSARHEVEVYRRELSNLLSSMNSALQGANANGIQRAQRLLTKISAQVRQKRAKDRGRS